ncbi:MAG: cupredoxin family copper-binding protein [Dehalococcoidia bacterium]
MLAGVLSLALVACGGDDDDDAAAEGFDDAESTEEPADEGAGEATSEEEEQRANGTNVAIVDFAFDPAALQVNVGDTVTWTNGDSAGHTVTSDDEGIFDSGSLPGSETFEFTFEEAGSFAYHCNIHGGMMGTITVGEGASAPAADGETPVTPSGY